MAGDLIRKTCLSLDAAKAIAAGAEMEAARNGWAVSIAIVDEAGRLLYFQRMDDATNASVEVSIAKALHAANFRRPSKFQEDLLAGGNLRVLAVPGMLPLEGGLQVLHEGQTIGAIGVSGVQASQDGEIATAGLAAFEQWLSDANP